MMEKTNDLKTILVQYDKIIDILYHLDNRLQTQSAKLDDMLQRYDDLIYRVDSVLNRRSQNGK